MKLGRRAALVLGTSTVLFAAIYACVPADTRPVPSSLFLAVAASPETRSGLLTADGWNLSFERVLVGIGRTALSSSCTRYSEASYDRLLEVSQRGPQKLSVLYGIGRCDLRFRIGTPSSEALLGEGTADADVVKMRTRGQDRWVNRGGITLEVVGNARRGDTVKAFDFVFRTQLRLSACSQTADGGEGVSFGGDAGEEEPPDASTVDSGADAEAPPPEGVGVVLETGGELTQELRLEAEALFRSDPTDTARIRFDPYAAADTDGDDRVTLEELVRVPIGTIRDGGAFEAGLTTGTDGGGRSVLVESLGDYVVIVLLPRLLRYGAAGRCRVNMNIDLGRPDGGGGGRGGGGGGGGP